MSFSYANPTSGPSAGGIGWFNFGNLTLAPGQTATGLTGTLNGGYTVTFDLTAQNPSGAPRNFVAVPSPTWGGAFFGVSNYTGILGNPILYSTINFQPGTNGVTLSNIVVKDANGNPVPNYVAFVADAESTGATEQWTWNTNGGNWNLFATLGNTISPVLTGIGSPTVSFNGSNNPTVNQNDYVLTTLAPSELILNTMTTNTAGGRRAIAIGFAVTRIIVQKNIGQRIDTTDQFLLNIAGSPSASATTTGGADGLQTETAVVYALPGVPYTISEAMAPGSASALTQYTRVTSAANNTPAGTVPPTGTLPVTFTPAVGDDVTYTLLNAAPETFSKTVDKAYADIGEVLTYTVTVNNPNNFTINNVLVTDPVPNGTTYVMRSLAADVTFTGTPLTTIHLTNAIAAGETVSLTYQVLVAVNPNPNPIPNTISAAFTYTVNPLAPNGLAGTSVSNTVNTLVFRNNYSQQISDLIHSIALEEAAIGNIANAEGAKIQRMLAMGATPKELLCVNKSVADMLEALGTLESVLKQKLSAVDCQISPTCMP